jgi:hypothetical protein
MRSVDDRVVAVQKRTGKLRRERDVRVLVAAICLAAFPIVGLVGRTASGEIPELPLPSEPLFGAASLFGSSAGGYVIVATISFAVAVALTVLLMLRRRSSTRDTRENERLPKDETKANGRQEGTHDER